jgi:hypothetical protein
MRMTGFTERALKVMSGVGLDVRFVSFGTPSGGSYNWQGSLNKLLERERD